MDLEVGNLSEVINEVSAVMAEKLRQDGFTLHLDTKGLKPFPYDREALIQILINLVENSVKFGAKGNRKEITIRARSEKNKTLLSVSDTGPGLESKELSRIFDDFYRSEKAVKDNTKGTGIGLALVRRMVEAMGGSVKASNNQDKDKGPGLTVTMTLGAPIDEAE